MTTLTYGTVTGRFDDLVAGGTAITGSVIFRAQAGYLLSAETAPKTIILPAPVTVDLVESAFSVSLIATDNASLNPTDWTYRVEFDLRSATGPINRSPISIDVPSGVVTDLADASPVAASGGTAIVRGLKGDTGPAGPTGPTGPATTNASLLITGTLPEAVIPSRLSNATLDATYADYVNLAKNPDAIVAGAITLNGTDQILTAQVVWPDGTPGLMTITARHSSGAVTAYNITYGSPVTRTFTQPTITRNTNGAVTNLPAIVVS